MLDDTAHALEYFPNCYKVEKTFKLRQINNRRHYDKDV